jgi:hypothetical protein
MSNLSPTAMFESVRGVTVMTLESADTATHMVGHPRVLRAMMIYRSNVGFNFISPFTLPFLTGSCCHGRLPSTRTYGGFKIKWTTRAIVDKDAGIFIYNGSKSVRSVPVFVRGIVATYY